MPPENTDPKTTETKDTSAEALAAENAKLKASLAALAPKLDKLEADEAKRAAAEKKREDEKRKKEEGADKVLEEKVKDLEATQARLAAYEKRERDRIGKAFGELPDELREPIAALESKVSVEEWAEIVEKQRAAAEKLSPREREREEPDDASSVTGVFLRSGTAEKKGYKVSPQAAKILEDQGRTLEHAEKLTARTEVDKESGHRITKFSKQVGSFFRDMGLEPVKRVLGERPRGQGQQQPPRK